MDAKILIYYLLTFYRIVDVWIFKNQASTPNKHLQIDISKLPSIYYISWNLV